MSAIDTILNSMRGQHVDTTLPPPVRTVPVWVLVWRWYCRCVAFNRSRRHLRDMSDQQLADIGVSREEADREADRWPRLWV